MVGEEGIGNVCEVRRGVEAVVRSAGGRFCHADTYFMGQHRHVRFWFCESQPRMMDWTFQFADGNYIWEYLNEPSLYLFPYLRKGKACVAAMEKSRTWFSICFQLVLAGSRMIRQSILWLIGIHAGSLLCLRSSLKLPRNPGSTEAAIQSIVARYCLTKNLPSIPTAPKPYTKHPSSYS